MKNINSIQMNIKYTKEYIYSYLFTYRIITNDKNTIIDFDSRTKFYSQDLHHIVLVEQKECFAINKLKVEK